MITFLSIIIPCYNCSSTIIRTLESIPQTSDIGIEVILIDDYSTDNTIDVIKEFAISNEWVRLIALDSNHGPANARNVGIEASTGRYLAFIDSDDTVSSDYLKMVRDAVLSSQADLLSIGISRVFGSTVTPIPIIDYSDQAEFLALATGSLCSIVSSKQLWEGVRLPSIRNAEDIAVIPILISRAKKVYHIKESLYNYILTPSSLSRKPRADVPLNFERSFEYTCQNTDFDNSMFSDAIEFHGIKTIIYGGVFNAIRCGSSKTMINQLVNRFESKFPRWDKNKYLEKYPIRKRLFLYCVKQRLFFILRLFVSFQELFLSSRSRVYK